MRAANLDPTAGRTGRAIHAHPEAPHRIMDPTDPRYGQVIDQSTAPAVAQPNFDPTDPTAASHKPKAGSFTTKSALLEH